MISSKKRTIKTAIGVAVMVMVMSLSQIVPAYADYSAPGGFFGNMKTIGFYNSGSISASVGEYTNSLFEKIFENIEKSILNENVSTKEVSNIIENYYNDTERTDSNKYSMDNVYKTIENISENISSKSLLQTMKQRYSINVNVSWSNANIIKFGR